MGNDVNCWGTARNNLHIQLWFSHTLTVSRDLRTGIREKTE